MYNIKTPASILFFYTVLFAIQKSNAEKELDRLKDTTEPPDSGPMCTTKECYDAGNKIHKPIGTHE